MSATPAATPEMISQPEAAVNKLPIKKQPEFQIAFDAMFDTATEARQEGLFAKGRDEWLETLNAISDEGMRGKLADEMIKSDKNIIDGIQTQQHFDDALKQKQREIAEISTSGNSNLQPKTKADLNSGEFSMKLAVPRIEVGREIDHVEGNASETYREQVLALKRSVAETAGSDQEKMQKLNQDVNKALENIRSNVQVYLEGEGPVSLTEWEANIEEVALVQWRKTTGKVNGTKEQYLEEMKDTPLFKFALEHQAEESLRGDKELKYKLVYSEEQKPFVVETPKIEETEVKPEKLKIQEETFQTAKDLLKIWDQNDNLVITQEKREIEAQDRRPVLERGRLGILVATYEGTTLPEAKLFLSGEIHRFLRRQNVDANISSELRQKVIELSENDQMYKEIQEDALMRVSSLAGVEMPPGALRGELLTDVLYAHACKKHLAANYQTQSYEFAGEAREAISNLKEKGLLNIYDERLIKQLILTDSTDRILSNVYGFDLALLEDTNNGPVKFAEKVVKIVHPEWTPESIKSMTPEDAAKAKEQSAITEKIMLNDIWVGWQRYKEATKKNKWLSALGMLGMIALPVASPLLDFGSFNQDERRQMGMQE